MFLPFAGIDQGPQYYVSWRPKSKVRRRPDYFPAATSLTKIHHRPYYNYNLSLMTI